ncbi:hypothetical protein LJC49_08495 [Ruminococcaceae bacterium OttesenSCG-928-I18]|nr:hypothetical protein [Ruminococcaceae bacterium OttesenSCG-928-I18]
MSDTKIKFALWMYPKTQNVVQRLYKTDNCRSQSEFIEKAIHFYAGYISSQDSTLFLSDALLPAIKGFVQDSEHRIRQNLFKQAVEVALNTRVIATYEGIEALPLSRMRGQVVNDLKRTNGGIKLDEAVRDTSWVEKLDSEDD